MTKNGILFGLAAGGVLGLFIPRMLGADFGIINIFTGIIGAILGLIGVGAYVHWYGRIR